MELQKITKVGIDLGTSNCVLSYMGEDDRLVVLDIPQIDITKKGIVEKNHLPSFIYLPLEDMLGNIPFAVDGDQNDKDQEVSDQENGLFNVGTPILGIYAKEQGSFLSEQYIASAKSWLCHKGISKKSAILPFGSSITEKISPFEAITYFLSHLRKAFEYKTGLKDWSNITTTITLPASFDEEARALVEEAAINVGFLNLYLLEEPQAAFYSWLYSHDSWRKIIKEGELILICDIGGGTCDFSLICATASKYKELQLERISVGNHLLLGGDNMDLALSYRVKFRLEAEGISLDRWQFISLISQVRRAKEVLLSSSIAPIHVEEFPIAIAPKGSSLFAKTISTTVSRAEVLETILEGFFPRTDGKVFPKRSHSSGLQEIGLAYEADPAITKHLAQFLQISAKNRNANEHLKTLLDDSFLKEREDILLPTAVLFNGGVFNSQAIKARLVEILESWQGSKPIKILENDDLDLAVSKGAAYFSSLKQSGEGIRIKAGTPRSYYMGIESNMPAVPGFTPPLKAICIVPQGTEEGTKLPSLDRQFGLMVGEPAEFLVFSSTQRAGDHVGVIVEDARKELQSATVLKTELENNDGQEAILPVQLEVSVTDLGSTQLFMKHVHSEKKWKLEFDIRDHD